MLTYPRRAEEQPRLGRLTVLKPDLVADRAANLLAELRGDALRLRKQRVRFSAFTVMFVPSLSWQMFGISRVSNAIAEQRCFFPHHRDGGDPSRLCADDATAAALTALDRVFEQELRHLCRLPAAGLAAHNQHLLVSQRSDELVALGVRRQLPPEG